MVETILILLVLSLLFVAFVFTFGKKPDEIEVFEEVRNPVLLQIKVPRENEKTPLAAEQMFASLHGILRDAKKSLDMISFEVVSMGEGGIQFYAVAPAHLAKFVEGQIYAQYPNAEISHVSDYTVSNKGGQNFISAGIVELEKDYIFPVKTFRDFEVDSLAAITSAVSDLKENEEAWVQIIIRPVSNYWQESSKKYITAIREGKSLDDGGILGMLFGFVAALAKSFQTTDETGVVKKEVVNLAPGQEEEMAKIEEKMLKLGFEMCIRVEAKSSDQYSSEQ